MKIKRNVIEEAIRKTLKDYRKLQEEEMNKYEALLEKVNYKFRRLKKAWLEGENAGFTNPHQREHNEFVNAIRRLSKFSEIEEK